MESSKYRIEQLNPTSVNSTLLFLEEVFSIEQNIPKELIPVKADQQKWWAIKDGNQIVGTAAIWQINSEWHWGRLAIHEKLRGLGLGKKLVTQSLEESFQMGIETILIDARDITVDMILKLGGKIVGEKINFYGLPVTPMELRKRDFVGNEGL